MSGNATLEPSGTADGYARIRQTGQAILVLASWAEGLALRVAGAVRALAVISVLIAVACAWLVGSASEASPAFHGLILLVALSPAGVLLAFHMAVRRAIGMPRRLTETMTGTAQSTLDAVGSAGQRLRKPRPTFREFLSGVAEVRKLVDSGRAAAGLLTDTRQMVLAFNPLSLLVVAIAALAVIGQVLLVAVLLLL